MESKPQIPNRTVFTRDNLEILRGMDDDSVDLIYLDPPFNSNRHYAAPVGSAAAGAGFKDAWTLDDIDIAWLKRIRTHYPRLHEIIVGAGAVGGRGDKSYLIYMAIRLLEMRRILKSSGSIYLHCDPTMSHSLKLVMDAVFGKKQFRNEIVWCYTGPGSPQMRQFNRKHDIILWYAKGEKWTFNKDAVRVPYKDPNQTLRRAFDSGKGIGKEEIDKYRSRGKIPETWWAGFAIVARSKKENLGYPTQKPLALLERIINASSNKGDLVLDPFCGCATTCIAAEKLDRRWIGIDLSSKAVELVKKRLHKDLAIGDKDNPAMLEKAGYKVISRTDIPKKTGTSVRSKNIKTVLYGLQSGHCNGCGEHFRSDNLTIDHVIPQSHGGDDGDDNLQLLCGHCNSVKGDRTMDYLIAKLREEARW